MPGMVPPAFLPPRGDGAGRQAHDTVECPFLGKGVHRIQRLADQRAVVGAARMLMCASRRVARVGASCVLVRVAMLDAAVFCTDEYIIWRR